MADSEIIPASMPDTNTVTPPQDGPEKPVAAVAKRNRWVPIKVPTAADSKPISSYPFLAHSNVKDRFLMQGLLEHLPFQKAYGNVTVAWEKMVEELNAMKDEDGTHVFSQPLIVRTAKERFDKYITAAKLKNKVATKTTGCDQEPAATEIEVMLENLLSLYDEHVAKEENQGKRLFTENMSEKIKGQLMRDENFSGYLQMKNENEHNNNNNDNDNDNNITNKKQRVAAPKEALESLTSTLADRNERKKEKNEIIKINAETRNRQMDAQITLMQQAQEDNRMLRTLVLQQQEESVSVRNMLLQLLSQKVMFHVVVLFASFLF
jgi:hypothetical protein